MDTVYEVQTRFIFDRWENCWTIDDKELETFNSIEEAQAEIDDAISTSPEGDATQSDYRIVETSKGGK